MRSKQDIAKDQADRRVIPDGIYPFQVNSAIDGYSKNGAAMVSLELYVWDDNNRQRAVKDWLGDWNFGDVKILGFCEATGQDYNCQMLTARECVDKEGYLVIKIEESEQYGDQPKVSYYVPVADVETVKERLARKAGRALPKEKFYKPTEKEIVSVGAGDNDDLPF